MSTPSASCYVGTDAAKEYLDVAVRLGGTGWRVTNDAAGIAALAARPPEPTPALHPQAATRLEAPGGYERPLAAALAAAGLPVAVVNPRQVRDFAWATVQLAKTDRLDARAGALRRGGAAPSCPEPGAEAQALAAILARRRQVVGMLTAAQNRLGTATEPVWERIGAHIAWLEQGLADVDGELARAIAADPAWRERDARRPGAVQDPARRAARDGRALVAQSDGTRRRGPAQSRQRHAAGRARSGAAGRGCAARSTWPRSLPRATTRPSPSSTSACAPPARPRSPPWSPACESC